VLALPTTTGSGTCLVRGSEEMSTLESRKRQAPVLVLDDDADERADTMALLTDDGWTAVAESDGDSALRYTRTSLTLLLVSELYIPCAEGLCIVAVLKGDRSRLPRLQILVHTRHTEDPDIEWALAAGCDAIVHKSAAPGVLAREVHRLESFAP
jgi:CheY-like chemotaxis protein